MCNNAKLTVLKVDLSLETAVSEIRPDLQHLMGGSGLATGLLAENIHYDVDALSPVQPIVLAIGPLTGIFPAITKTVAMFRSPLTGNLGESHAGMRLGMALRFAGYDAVVITGRASRPIYLVVNSKGVEFKPAGPLWGMSTDDTGRILREREQGSGHRSCLRIGPAGEQLVRYAGVNVDTYRHFGRMGLGAVFGSKLLKAIVFQGDLNEFPIIYPQAYAVTYQETYRRVTATSLMAKYHGLGTAGNLLTLQETRGLPTRNLAQSQFELAEEISGEAFAQHSLLRKLACAGCPVGCIHLAMYRTSFGTDQEYEFAQLAYDYELLYALGSLLGLGKREDVLSLIASVEQAGLDAISTGVVLAWATEALQEDRISLSELGSQLQFGEASGYLTAIQGLIAQPNELYRSLAQGVAKAAAQYGGEAYALALGGNEVAGYHTGYANLLGQAVGARHSHLDNAGYSLDQAKPGQNRYQTVDQLITEELERDVLTSLCICLFARKVYDFAIVEKALAAVGMAWHTRDLYRLGRETFLAKRNIKEKLGFEQDTMRFPRRFFQTAALNGMLERQEMQQLMQLYQQRVSQLQEGSFPLPM